MAVQERQYNDPTAGIFQLISNLGGTQTTSRTGGNIAPLQAVYDQQALGMTPEGARELIASIFQTGMSQVPGLATTYGQAAGARTSNNSGLKLAMQDMFTKLSAEAARQLSSNQQAASQTAGRIADATRTETKQAKPKFNPMQLMPFALANAGKLKDLGKNVFGGGSSSGGGSFSMPAWLSGGSAGGYAGETGANMDVAFADYAFDPGSLAGIELGGAGSFGGDGMMMDYGAGMDFGGAVQDVDFFGGDFDLGFADGGLVQSGKSTLSRRGQDIEDAIIKGEGGEKQTQKKEEPKKEEEKKKGLNTRVFDLLRGKGFANGGLVTRAPGYANGGAVRNRRDDVNFGGAGAFNKYDNQGRQVRGVTYNQSDDYYGVREGMFNGYNDSAPRRNPNVTTRPVLEDAGSSGVGSGVGPAASGSGNSGLGLDGISAAAAAAAANAVGVPGGMVGVANSSNNSNAVGNTVGMAVSIATANPVIGMVVDAVISQMNAAAAGGVASGMPGVSVDNANAVSAISDTDPLDTLVSQIDAVLNGGNTAAVASQGGVSDGSGGAVGTSDGGSVGTAGDGGVGSGGAFRKGGSVNGPGTKTSDSIKINVSDGEYIVRAKVVENLGVDFFDVLNSMFDGPAPGTARGEPVRR